MSPQINYPLDCNVKYINFYIFLVRLLACFELNTEGFEPPWPERENKNITALLHIYSCIMLVYQHTHIEVKTGAFQGSKKNAGINRQN